MTNPIDLPPIPGSRHVHRNNDTAPAYYNVDSLWIVLADGNDTGGRHSMMEQLMPKDSGPPPHVHTWSDETYYLLDGEMTILIGDESVKARKGDYLVVPRNTRHGFRVDSNNARILNGYTPASLELGVAEMATPAPRREIPPKGATPPPKMTSEQYRRYGMENLPGPNPLATDTH